MFAVRLALIATGVVEAVTAAWVLGCTSCALPILVGRELSVNAPALPSIVAQLGAVRCALALFILTAGAVTVSTDVLHKFAVCAAVHVCVLQPFVLTSARSSPCLPRERTRATNPLAPRPCPPPHVPSPSSRVRSALAPSPPNRLSPLGATARGGGHRRRPRF